MTTAHGAEPDWRAVWEATLADLEQDVEAAEAVLAAVRRGDHEDLPTMLGSWAPPTGIAPLPESMLERAQLVLERQLRVIEDVANAATRSRQQNELSRRMRSDQAPSRPLYVDATY
jgi:phytoene dehydrogenase-like protein